MLDGCIDSGDGRQAAGERELLGGTDGAFGVGTHDATELLGAKAAMHVPRQRLAAVNGRLGCEVAHLALQGLGTVAALLAGTLALLAGAGCATLQGQELRCLVQRVGQKVEAFGVGHQRHRVGARANCLDLDQELELAGIGTQHRDFFDLHAAIHVEGFTLEYGGKLDAHQVFHAIARDEHTQLIAEHLHETVAHLTSGCCCCCC
mmetsp:Transcript_11018/g.33741  ORF Transcript_11018/g.33741 Transcript_11018/m.33741 type:complete len:205 (+) Transcript_11018:718-1332(+)